MDDLQTWRNAVAYLTNEAISRRQAILYKQMSNLHHNKTDWQVKESLPRQYFSRSLCRRLENTLQTQLSHFPVHRTRLKTSRANSIKSTMHCNYKVTAWIQTKSKEMRDEMCFQVFIVSEGACIMCCTVNSQAHHKMQDMNGGYEWWQFADQLGLRST